MCGAAGDCGNLKEEEEEEEEEEEDSSGGHFQGGHALGTY
jgi:hypothetical protein